MWRSDRPVFLRAWQRLCPTFAADMRARTGAVQRWTAARFPSRLTAAGRSL